VVVSDDLLLLMPERTNSLHNPTPYALVTFDGAKMVADLVEPALDAGGPYQWLESGEENHHLMNSRRPGR
jgi:hypothetical protein